MKKTIIIIKPHHCLHSNLYNNLRIKNQIFLVLGLAGKKLFLECHGKKKKKIAREHLINRGSKIKKSAFKIFLNRTSKRLA